MGTEDEVALGVDFGTTNSVVAVFHDDSVDVLTNDIDKRTTPSCVYIRDSERQVGEAALRLATSYPANTIRSVKSILGRVHESKAPRSLGAVDIGGAAVGKGVVLKINNTENSTKFSPEEVVAMILLELKKSAELQLGRQVNKVVVAVPSYFTASQRKAVMDSASLAGLGVPHMLNETTAAAMAYAHDREEEKTVVMVDIGGGGSAVAVVKVVQNQVEVLAHSGVRLPGGEDFDIKMIHYLKQLVKEKHDKEVGDPRDCEILRSQWAKAKEKLSRIPRATINVYLPGVAKDFICDVSRSQFDETCAEHFQSIVDGLVKTLKMAKVQPPQLGEVLLVGGCSRIPRLRAMVQEAVEGKAPCKAINPDEAVALGAALLAAGRVKLTKELLTIRTVFKADKIPTTVDPNTKLQYLLTTPSSQDISLEILQETNGCGMTYIYKGNLPRGSRIGIFVSGLVQISDAAKKKVEWVPLGCLTSEDLDSARRKMETFKKREDVESRRVESKNALEDMLRGLRVAEIPNDDFRDEAANLRDEFDRQLQWLLENGNKTCQDYDEKLNHVRSAYAELEGKRERERNRVKTRDILRQTLKEILEDEIPDGPHRNRALKLQQRCKNMLDWVRHHSSDAEENFNRNLLSVSKARDELQTDITQHASDQRKASARKDLEEVLTGILKYVELIPAVSCFNDHREKLLNLYAGEYKWLQSSRSSNADEDELKNKSLLIERQISELKLNYTIYRDQLEAALTESKKAAEKKLLEVLQMPDLHPDEPLHNDVTQLKEWCESKVEWIAKNENGTIEQYTKITESVLKGLDSLREKRAAEEARRQVASNLENALQTGLQVEPRSGAEESCRKALEGARAAGCVALLLDQEAVGEHNFVTLSVRYVLDTGDAVEHLLLYQDMRLFNGTPKELAHAVLTRFEELCQKFQLDWQSRVNFLSARTRGPFGEAFEQLCVEKLGTDFKHLTSMSVTLDKRMANACYRGSVPTASSKEKLSLQQFFKLVDLFRQTQVIDCNHDPWLTYTTSIVFLYENQAALRRSTETVLEHPNSELANATRNAFNDTKFMVCLVAFHCVLSKFEEVRQLFGDFSDFQKFSVGLTGLQKFCRQSYAAKNIDRCVADIVPVESDTSREVTRLIHIIIGVAFQVVKEAKDDCSEYCRVSRCLTSGEEKHRSCIGEEAHKEYVLLRGRFPGDSLDSPRFVLSKLRRSEFRRHYQALYTAMQRVMTMPLLPPSGPSSAQQLWDLACRAASESPMEAVAPDVSSAPKAASDRHTRREAPRSRSSRLGANFSQAVSRTLAST